MGGGRTNQRKSLAAQKLVYGCRNGISKKTRSYFCLRLDRLDPLVLRKIKEHLLPEARGEELRALVEARASKLLSSRPRLPDRLTRLRAQLKETQGKIEQAVQNLGRVKGRAADLLAGQIEAWSCEVDELEKQIAREGAEETQEQATLEEVVEGLSLWRPRSKPSEWKPRQLDDARSSRG